MGKERTAVLGVGQTEYRSTRGDVSMAGLVREAALRALADALGCAGKPILRVHTAGSVGGSTALVATSLVQAGVHRRVLTLGFEKQSESNATWALSLPQPFSVSINAGAGGYFSPIIRQYMARSGAPDLIGCMVAFKDRQHALRNPYAHLHQADLTFDQVVEAPMLWDPIRYSETCPSSDGACAMVLGDEAAGDASPKPVAWVHGTAMRSEANNFPGRDEVSPQASRDCAADVFRQAGITQGWRMVEEGATHLDGGDLPVNCSGGVLSSNPIGASGMIRFAEAALQVRGMAGEHQVDGARRAFGHAYGGGAQYFAMWVVGADKP